MTGLITIMAADIITAGVIIRATTTIRDADSTEDTTIIEDTVIMMEDAIMLGIKALHKGTEGKLNPDATEIGVVDEKIPFHILTQDKTKEYVVQAIGGS